ncbi:hypothetical protein ABTZ03_14140 [Kitasatospora sp. NPDC096077]|uniref:hypothetical protein n=1 Tax=Kitasatospora sp. NPDC096077 TaxID=3155544 RepID=UPI00331FAEDE
MTRCDYFSAVDDQAAVAVVGLPGGPGEAGHDVVFLKNIDPVVAIAQLEAILTDCTYEEASRRPRSGRLLSSPEDDASLVFSLSDTLVEALAAVAPTALAHAAEPWSMTAELRQCQVDARTALGVLESLAGLVRRAGAAGLRVYCWWSL